MCDAVQTPVGEAEILTRFRETGHLAMRVRSRIGLALTIPVREAPG